MPPADLAKKYYFFQAGSSNPTAEVFVHMLQEDGKGKTVKMEPPEEVRIQ